MTLANGVPPGTPFDPPAMTAPALVTIRAGSLRLDLCPRVGGAITALTRDGVDVLRPLPPNVIEQRNARLLACFPLLPYSNRIAWGRFRWNGTEYQLDHNFPDHPHTMHGVGWQQPWQVAEQAGDRVRLALDYDPAEAGLYTWPFRLHAEAEYALDPDGLRVTLSVRNDDHVAWPAGLGLHPYYPRTADMQVFFRAEAVWTRTPDSLPVAPEPIPPAWRFDPPRAPDGPMLDNCFRGWDGRARLAWPSLGHAVTVEADPQFGHLVVYAPDELPVIALEPATNMPDAINRMEAVPGNGLRLLQPGETLSGTVRLGIERLG